MRTRVSQQGRSRRDRHTLHSEESPPPGGSGDPRVSPEQWFAVLVAGVLGGYMFFSRPFAYVGVPALSLFVGEVVVVTGVALALRHRQAVLTALPGSSALQVIGLLLALAAARLAVDLPRFGLLAARDSAIVGYAVLALVVVGVLRARPWVLPRLLGWYGRAVPWLLAWAPVAIVVNRAASDASPLMPGTDVPLLGFKPGDVAVHVAVAVAFLWLWEKPSTPAEFRRRQLLTALGVVGLLVAGSQNRGGLVAAAVVMAFVLLRREASRGLVATGLATLLIVFSLALTFDLRIELGHRDVSAVQVLRNLQGMTGGVDEGALRGTVDWRLAYWSAVAADSLDGTHGMFGLGFGPNVADQYGYQVAGDDAQQRLRNVHNSHLTLLVRMGPPAFALWLLLWGAWFRAVGRGAVGAAATPPGDLAAWLLAAVAGILVNAIFDPTLEGPQVALWLWTLVGAGAALRHAEVRAALAGGGRVEAGGGDGRVEAGRGDGRAGRRLSRTAPA